MSDPRIISVMKFFDARQRAAAAARKNYPLQRTADLRPSPDRSWRMTYRAIQWKITMLHLSPGAPRH